MATARSTLNRVVAYRVPPGEQPIIQYAGVVSPDIVLAPAHAVIALRVHQFTEAFVKITQTSADEIRALWDTGVTHENDTD